jgi:hypothetical protein
MMTDPHRELRDNLSNIDPAWQGEIKALLDDRDLLLRTFRVEKGITSAAVEGWSYVPKVPAEMWVWNGPFTHNVRPVIVRKSARVWELRQNPQGGAALTFPTALEAMLADPPWNALEDGETQEVTLW